MKNTILSLIDCTESLKWESDMGRLNVPGDKKGAEKFTSIRKGSAVISSGRGPLNRGIPGKVLKTEKNNGYNRYTVEWEGGRTTFERELDIEKSA